MTTSIEELVELVTHGEPASRDDALADLMETIDVDEPDEGMAALRPHVGAILGSPALGAWVDRNVQRLEDADLDYGALDEFALERSALELLLACDPAALAGSSFQRFTLDAWNERLLVPPAELAVEQVPRGVPRTHWWWFPEAVDSAILDAMEPFESLTLGVGARVDELSARAAELDFGSRFTALACAAAVHDIAPADRVGEARGARLCLELGRRVVGEGEPVDGARDVLVGQGSHFFARGRVVAGVRVGPDGGATLASLQPRQRVPVDAPADLEGMFGALAAAAGAASYLERRLHIANAMDLLAPVGRAVSTGLLDRADVGARLAAAVGHRDTFIGWRVAVERRLDSELPPIDQLREDRSALEFLLELSKGFADDSIFEELVDLPGVLDDWLRGAGSASVSPNGNPDQHWWWNPT